MIIESHSSKKQRQREQLIHRCYIYIIRSQIVSLPCSNVVYCIKTLNARTGTQTVTPKHGASAAEDSTTQRMKKLLLQWKGFIILSVKS